MAFKVKDGLISDICTLHGGFWFEDADPYDGPADEEGGLPAHHRFSVDIDTVTTIRGSLAVDVGPDPRGPRSSWYTETQLEEPDIVPLGDGVFRIAPTDADGRADERVNAMEDMDYDFENEDWDDPTLSGSGNDVDD